MGEDFKSICRFNFCLILTKFLIYFCHWKKNPKNSFMGAPRRRNSFLKFLANSGPMVIGPKVIVWRLSAPKDGSSNHHQVILFRESFLRREKIYYFLFKISVAEYSSGICANSGPYAIIPTFWDTNFLKFLNFLGFYFSPKIFSCSIVAKAIGF